MTLLSDILKGSAWGLVLLALMGIFVTSSFEIFDRAKSFYINDEPATSLRLPTKTFYTNSKKQQYKNTNAALADLPHKPELQIEAAKEKYEELKEAVRLHELKLQIQRSKKQYKESTNLFDLFVNTPEYQKGTSNNPDFW